MAASKLIEWPTECAVRVKSSRGTIVIYFLSLACMLHLALPIN